MSFYHLNPHDTNTSNKYDLNIDFLHKNLSLGRPSSLTFKKLFYLKYCKSVGLRYLKLV